METRGESDIREGWGGERSDTKAGDFGNFVRTTPAMFSHVSLYNHSELMSGVDLVRGSNFGRCLGAYIFHAGQIYLGAYRCPSFRGLTFTSLVLFPLTLMGLLVSLGEVISIAPVARPEAVL